MQAATHTPADTEEDGRFEAANRWGPRLLVAAVVAVNIIGILPTLKPAAYLDDASMHEQMVRYATATLRHGSLPQRGWFPYLGLGSPHFLHYQSLGATITGAAGLLFGADVAFRWSLLILWGAWPLVVFIAARAFGLRRWAAATAALVAPLICSVPEVGFERAGYTWIGYGLWSQAWGMWTLPLAWACSWRASSDRRFIAPAVLFTSLTIAFHYETGYLALGAVMLWPWLVPSDLKGRVVRGAVTLALSFVAAAWVLVPLERFGPFASINEFFTNDPIARGYGAKTVLGWLIRGQVFDNGRFPVVTILAAIGVICVLVRWRGDPLGRALLVVGLASLVLCFGRTTFGPVFDVIPAHNDLFFRRFMEGAQLAGVLLAGVGAETLVKVLWSLGRRGAEAVEWSPVVAGGGASLIGLVAIGAALSPAVNQVRKFDDSNKAYISTQDAAQRGAPGREIQVLIDRIKRAGGGRTYAGAPNNWGEDFNVGYVPVFKYIESQNVDEVGYTLRTASLMTDPEAYMDPTNPGDLALFGIRWLIYPDSMAPPAGATSVEVSGPYHLWELRSNHYLEVVDTVGTLVANRGDVGHNSENLLYGNTLDQHEDLTVAWAGARAAAPTEPRGQGHRGRPGRVISEHADLVRGETSGVVDLRRRAVVLLSASYDPGWEVFVDGHRARTEMLAPAVPGVVVPAGRHRVAFRYVGYDSYPEVGAVSVLGLLLAIFISTGAMPDPKKVKKKLAKRFGKQEKRFKKPAVPRIARPSPTSELPSGPR